MVVDLNLCNTKHGIMDSFGSLASFNHVLKMRHYAGYEKKIRLDPFIISKTLFLDTCGNVMKINKWESESGRELSLLILPTVIHRDELSSYGDWSFSCYLSNDIPDANVCCSQCGKRWGNHNFLNDVIVKRLTKDMDLKEYIGENLKHVVNVLHNRNDARYLISKPYTIFNDKKSVEVDGDYIIKDGDSLYYSKWMYFHKECIKEKREREMSEYLENNGEGYIMPNVAGLNEEVDIIIKGELLMAGIDINYDPNTCSEANANFGGIFGPFQFYRAWSYWTVKGPMPLDLAIEMYDDPIGKQYVRVCGHCGCPHPNEWVHYINEEGKEYGHKAEVEKFKDSPLYESILNSDNYIWVDDPSVVGIPVIPSYHIDTIDGLKLFVKTAKKILQSTKKKVKINQRLESI